MRFENTCLLVHGSLVVVVRSAACTALDRRQQMRARRSQPRKLTGSQAVEQPSPKAQRQRVIIVDPSGGFLGGSNREHAVGQKGTMGGGGVTGPSVLCTGWSAACQALSPRRFQLLKGCFVHEASL